MPALSAPTRAARRPPRRTIRTIAAALATIATLALAGCSFNPLTPIEHLVAPGAAARAEALKPYYDQRVQWGPCADGMECGEINAPLNWTSPSKQSIHLALIMHPATGTRYGSIVVNPGGPGASGVDFVGSGVENAVDSTIARHYDIVGFDPRGVGNSSAVKCYGATKMDSYLYGVRPGAIGSKTWLAAQRTADRKFADACRANTGPLLGHVDSVSAAHDLDLMRSALGESKLNYLGYSYGTFLGTLYAGLYPHQVGRFVFDGADDPWEQDSASDNGTAQDASFEGDLNAFLRGCLAGHHEATGSQPCAFDGSLSAARTEILARMTALDAHPQPNADGRKLDSNTYATAIFSALYSTSEWPKLNRMFADVEAGDPSVAFELADEYNDRDAKGQYEDNLAEANDAISCLDYGSDDNTADMRTEATALRKAAPVLGIYDAYSDIQCGEWPYQPISFPDPVHAPGAGPIVVIGSTGDPATPYEGAKQLAAQLDNGHLITYVGEGHTVYDTGVPCIDHAVDGYLEHGTVPASGLRCH